MLENIHLKLFSVFLIFLVLTPLVCADEEDEDDSSWLGEIVSGIMDKIVDMVKTIINAPIKPLVSLIKDMLSAVVNLDLFKSLWAIILYTLSLFYSLLLLYSGVNFMISGYDMVKREKAKEWLKNMVLIMVLVQASFFFYKVLIELSSILTTAILNMISNEFFLITFNSLIEIIFYLIYLAILIITSLILIIRYLVVSFGVVFFPIGIFLYFIPFTKDYGRMILNFLIVNIFLSFSNAVILLCCSKLIEIPLFEHYKILVMTCSFLLVSLTTIYLMFFSLVKSSVNVVTSVTNPISNLAKRFS